jgi:hypothetical protein
LPTIQALKLLNDFPDNRVCADCKSECKKLIFVLLDPSFVSVNLGIALCVDCSLAHIHSHGLNTPNLFASLIRPIRFFSWKYENFDLIKNRGNAKSNVFFEALESIPLNGGSFDDRMDYINRKYIQQIGTTPFEYPEVEGTLDVDLCLLEKMYQYMATDSIEKILELIIWGLDLNRSLPGRLPPLHEACALGNSFMIHLFLTYGANPNLLDEHSNSPLYYLYLKCHDLMAVTFREFQIYHQAIHNYVNFDPSPPPVLLAKLQIHNRRLITLSNREFDELLFDTVSEIAKRSQILKNNDSNRIEGDLTVAKEKLGSLSDGNLRELANAVFEEHMFREYRKLATGLFQQRSGSNTLTLDAEPSYEWLDLLRKRQLFERQTARSLDQQEESPKAYSSFKNLSSKSGDQFKGSSSLKGSESKNIPSAMSVFGKIKTMR